MKKTTIVESKVDAYYCDVCEKELTPPLIFKPTFLVEGDYCRDCLRELKIAVELKIGQIKMGLFFKKVHFKPVLSYSDEALKFWIEAAKGHGGYGPLLDRMSGPPCARSESR